ncbi:Putative phospholipid-transporting ATPase C24B11.12c [Psilocybe cubensis]|uniref:Phospholipid-transporting ATPase C24B11.12c n=1 Tax=Psilocybe cubensis TaxID=181762 RepID=A0ACB8HB51_PSICU|nr:Putative phospholipid-transporting ATPase C24B11.12c [Psilocybe cubensis]KAH9484429.1 Putative phospholipid-transporting ATPase C24B11.12c [Psilocybe cubensis]
MRFDTRTRPAGCWVSFFLDKSTLGLSLELNPGLPEFSRFFLAIAILQFFPKFSTISPGLVILPLLIVLGITALKDAYEDVKRHQSDRRVNNSLVRVLGGGDFVNPNVMQRKSRTFVRGVLRTYGRRMKKVKRAGKEEELAGVTAPATEADVAPVDEVEYDDLDEHQQHHHHSIFPHRHSGEDARAHDRPHWKKCAWEDVAVGDFVKIMDNEPLPADIIICATSEEENVAFVETKNLDGETNLKSRNAVPALSHLRSARECASPHNAFRLDCDRPDVNMYKLNAAVKVGKETFPADMQTVLLRGTVLRNTAWVIGVVIFTGEDTRIVMNSGGTPSKRSKVERQMNPQVFINLILLAMMAIACGIVDSVLEHRYYPKLAPWLFGANRPGDNPSINGLITFAFALITFQNIVPISLYISIEFVRTCQAAFIYFDHNMVYNEQTTLARSWNLSDDLGQIEYIFSDKTGTLTQNSMVFRQCSIGGKIYTGEQEEERDSLEKQNFSPDVKSPPPAYASGDSRKNLQPDIPLEQLRLSGSSTAADKNNTDSASENKDDDGPTAPPPKVVHHFRDADLARDLESAVHDDLDAAGAAHARHLNGFFSVLALCHTVLTSVDPETGKIEYKAQSPDEAALVQAAADVGFVFRGREKEILYLQTPFQSAGGIESVDGHEGHHVGDVKSAKDVGGASGAVGPSSAGGFEGGKSLAALAKEGLVERYELLNILEFTSARKRMSVVLRKLDADDGRLFLLSKGADNVIFERLKLGSSEELKATTEKHLDHFASQGLRTLTLAYKVINEQEYNSWSERYHEATVAMEDRDGKIDAVSDELERDLRLLGATAIEDRLQDGVPETIADLKRAGIKVWVATGDKLETAIAIGHSTNLIGRESNIIVIRGNRSGRAVYDQILHAAQEFFPDSNILDNQGNPTAPSEADAEALSNSPRPMSRTSNNANQPSSYPAGGPLRRMDTGISSIVGSNNGDKPGGFVLVIDGNALEVALSDDRHKNLLLRLAMVCEGVICCRVSPLQKALVVKLVKDGLGAMTLAIGDGANDVSMIQAADVGVGISGEEGLQAVNSSDYAIAQFRFLKRLLLVHGHWSYARNGTMILNFFYKNIVCIGVLWWFQIYCAWSSNYVFEYTYLLFWNSFWTIAPVIGIGLFDRFADDHVLMAVPELYWYGREGKWFGMKQFIVYMFDGTLQSAIIFFLILYAYVTTAARSDGWQVSLYEFSTTMAFAAVFAANFYNGLNTSAWTGWVFFAVFIGDILVLVYTAVYNAISPGWFVTPVYGNNNFLFKSAFFWFGIPLTVLLALLPRYLYKSWKFAFAPDDVDILRYIYKKDPQRDLAQELHDDGPLRAMKRPRPASMASHGHTESVTSLPVRPSMDLRSASRTDMSTGIRSQHRGFDFSTEENGVAMQRMQTNLSERRQSSRNLATVQETGTTRKTGLRHVLSVPRQFMRKKGSNIKEKEADH